MLALTAMLVGAAVSFGARREYPADAGTVQALPATQLDLAPQIETLRAQVASMERTLRGMEGTPQQTKPACSLLGRQGLTCHSRLQKQHKNEKGLLCPVPEIEVSDGAGFPTAIIGGPCVAHNTLARTLAFSAVAVSLHLNNWCAMCR